MRSETFQPLPRGRHGIPRELVIANQRERLLIAATALLAEQGYASLAVSSVIERACVSRATFYEIFDGKLDCILAAQHRALDALEKAILDACRVEREWPRAVAAGMAAALDFAGRYSDAARLLLASCHALWEPELARRGIAVQERLAELLHKGASSCPSARSPSRINERAAVGAAFSIAAACFGAEEIDALPQLKPHLAKILLTPYLGANEADRVAAAT